MRTATKPCHICLLLIVGVLAANPSAATPSDPAAGTPPEGQAGRQSSTGNEQASQRYEEVIVVTASRFAQALPDVPAAISVLGRDTIAASPAQSYADLLRSLPGLNVSQTSARDMSMRARGATGVVDTGTLVLLDGRSVYQDFFDFVMWDLLPVHPQEIEQIEAVSGPGSAVWGPNALNGVVNIRTRSPRQIGNELRLRGGGGERGTGSASLAGTGVRGPWSYKGAISFFTQDPWDRPERLPSGQSGDFFENEGTRQLKFNARVDRGLDEAFLSLQGGLSTTSGIMHTGMGPFSIADSTRFWYALGEYTRQETTVRAYANIVDGDSTNLLNGLPFAVDTQAYDFSAHRTAVLAGGDHTLTYGGNFRLQRFDLSIAPAEDQRREGGAFIDDQILLDDHVGVSLGARIDGFSVLDGPVFSPRLAVLVRPTGDAEHTIRVSYGRAYRAPSLLENFAETVLISPLDLSAITGIPGLPPYAFPSAALGNPDLEEEQLDQVEVGYRGEVADEVWVNAAYYWSRRQNVLQFFPAELYAPFDPPPGWPLDPALLALVPLPKTFTFRNIGRSVDQGFEAGLQARIEGNDVFVNYSRQAEPDPDELDISEINVPPANRFNAGFNGRHDAFYYGAVVHHVGEAVWNDVLDARFHGPTDAFTTVDATIGVAFLEGRADVSLRATNLTDARFQQHVFGDVIGRRVVAELGFAIR